MSLSQALNQFAQNLGRYHNTNVLIVLHPFGIGIALARHQQLQDAIHILW